MALCFGLVLGGLSIRVPPFPSAVRDANGEPNPGKGNEDDLAVTVNEEVQSGLWLRESGHRGIMNHQCVEPSNLSEMYS